MDFVFKTEWMNAISKLKPEQQAEAYSAIRTIVEEQSMPEGLSFEVDFLLTAIYSQIVDGMDIPSKRGAPKGNRNAAKKQIENKSETIEKQKIMTDLLRLPFEERKKNAPNIEFLVERMLSVKSSSNSSSMSLSFGLSSQGNLLNFTPTNRCKIVNNFSNINQETKKNKKFVTTIAKKINFENLTVSPISVSSLTSRSI